MPTQQPKSPPINRFYHQLIRDDHLTFRKKCRDLAMQIFGHEALIAKKDMADIAHCNYFNIDFYRLNRITTKQLTWRKLLNPFKWIEILLVGPLELLSWSISRSKTFLNEYGRNHQLTGYKAKFFHFMIICLWLIAVPLNLCVNLITGVARRFLAPVRYLIRPAIDTDHTEVKSLEKQDFWYTAALFTGMEFLYPRQETAAIKQQRFSNAAQPEPSYITRAIELQ